MMRQTYIAVVVLVSTAACAHNGQVRDLEQRVAQLETQATHAATLEQRVNNLEASVHRMVEMQLSIERGMSSLASSFEEFKASLDRVMGRLERAATRRDRPAPTIRRPRPEPQEVYSVPVGSSPFRGPGDAKVTMIRAFEFACPFCERSRGTMDQLRKEYGSDLRIVYKHYIVHPGSATTPALAACAAREQNRYFDMEREIWDRGYKAGRDLGAARMEGIARRLGLDMRKFKRDMNGPACAKRVRDDQELLRKVGVRGTPAFFINGRYLSGARPLADFKQLIDEELAKADRVMQSQKLNKRDYYRHIVNTGKKGL